MTAESPVQLPSLDREIGPSDLPLNRRARPDDDRPFILRGVHAHARGRIAGGVDAVHANGRTALHHPRIARAEVLSGTLTPVGLERRLRVDGVELVERVVIPRSGPACFLEWRAEQEVLLHFEAVLPRAGSAPPDGPAVTTAEGVRIMERGLLVDDADQPLVLAFSCRPARLELGIRREPLRVDLPVPAGSSVRAVVGVAGRGTGVDDLLRVMSRTHVVVPARAAEARRVLDHGLVLHSPEPDLDDGLAWAHMELAGLVGEAWGPGRGVSSPNGSVERALAALAVGEAAAGRAELERYATPSTLATAAATSADHAAALLLLAAGYLAWTGDLRTLQSHWPAIRTAAALAIPDGGGEGGHAGEAVGVAALRSLVFVAEEVGDGELAGRIRRAVGAPGSGAPLVPWPQRTEEDERGGGAPGLVAAVVRGLLGAEPDASRGRLVLRPRLPTGWPRLSLRGLTVGGAVMELDYVRRGGVHRFTLRQESGAAPLRVVLEPELEGDRVVRATVDGEPAELQPVAADGRLRVPLQVVLDHERRVEVELEGRPG